MSNPIKLGILIGKLVESHSRNHREPQYEFYVGEKDTPAILDIPVGSIEIPSKSIILSRRAIQDIFAVLKSKYGHEFLRDVYFNRDFTDEELHEFVINSTQPHNQFKDVVEELHDKQKGYESISNDMFPDDGRYQLIEPLDDSRTREYLDTVSDTEPPQDNPTER